jgi:hypothetical protein
MPRWAFLIVDDLICAAEARARIEQPALSTCLHKTAVAVSANGRPCAKTGRLGSDTGQGLNGYAGAKHLPAQIAFDRITNENEPTPLERIDRLAAARVRYQRLAKLIPVCRLRNALGDPRIVASRVYAALESGGGGNSDDD